MNPPRSLILLLLGVVAVASAAWGSDTTQFSDVRAMFPAADHLGPSEGEPPSASVFGNNDVLGFVLQSADVYPIPAYSGKPINVLVGVDNSGHLRAIRILHHEEPVLVIGVSDQDIQRYVAQYQGLDITRDIRIGAGSGQQQVVDGLSGATITSMVLNRTIVESARKVASARGLLHAGDKGLQFEPPPPLWVSLWQDKLWQVTVLAIGLILLMNILLFQDWLARHPTFLVRVRTLYLLFTLLFIGVYAQAQLSVVNVLTFVNALLGGFRWESFLIDPMMFILWAFVAVTILLWGRGVYCGWLCPFGALQELLYRVGQRLGLPGRELPTVVHERLLAVKYLVFLGLLAVSLQSLSKAEVLAEVEPFKTVFTLRFDRTWPFIGTALLMLGVGLFVRKAFCRYLCPLGASLTFPTRFRIFDWLRRRKECGRPCQTCARECEVQAIRPTGEIVETECHYCLDCQVTYWNDQRCPPLAERRKKAQTKARLKRKEAI